MKNLYLTLLIMLTVVFTSSCQKDSDLLAEILISEEPIAEIDLQDAILLPSDFDWSNIPADFSDSIWEITEDYDLGGLTITLPPNVTLYFNGGSLLNGTLTGDKTVIISKTQTQVFEGLNLAGNFKTEYLKPYWFGAVMDGVTNDRDIFVETLKQSNNIGAKVMVEKDIFLDVEETGTKSIFLEDNTWIEGKNDSNVIINNLLSPAFYMVLTKNITFKNLGILWDQTYDASYITQTNDNSANVTQINEYLSNAKGIIFSGENAVWKGPRSLMAVFSLNASKDILFENVKIKAKGYTADKFIPHVFKFREEFSANQTVTNTYAPKDIPKNITFKNITLDGTLMGIQGTVHNFKSEGLKSYRYSDAQTATGLNIGGYDGLNYSFPPPHLFYLNSDSSVDYQCENIEILNTIDYGEYVGTKNVRPTISGYCNSLKLVGNQVNVKVENYKSYRRDGLGDLENISNGTFKNIYSESNSSIFKTDYKFSSLRFVGALTNVVFDNMTIKDKAVMSEIYPIDITYGDYVKMDNVNIYVNELNTADYGCFGVNGSNNTIINSTLHINKHTSKSLHGGVIVLNDITRKYNGSNNYYDISVFGWRNIDSDANGKSIKMFFHEPTNLNENYALVKDISNDFIIEQINAKIKDKWIRNEEITLGSGNSHLLNINIPYGFVINKISANTIENFASGISVSIGTNSTLKDNLLSDLSKTKGLVSKTINETIATNANRSIYLFANGDFNFTGKVKVTLELIRMNNAN